MAALTRTFIERIAFISLFFVAATATFAQSVTIPLGPPGSSVLVLTGQTVLVLLTNMPYFGSPASNSPPYQWFKNGIPLDRETNAWFYVSTNTVMGDAASYSASVSGQYGSATTTLDMGVYYLYTTNSNGGGVSLPLTFFTYSSRQLICSGKTFDGWYNVTNLFYGPNTTNQIGPFQNTSGSTKLDLSTCNTDNGATLDTGLVLAVNAWGGQIVACSDDAGSACGINSCLSTSSANLAFGTRYRLTLFYRTATLGNLTSITFCWYYHN